MDLQGFQLEIVWPKIRPTKSIIATLMAKIVVAQIRNYLRVYPTCIYLTKLVNAREQREFLLLIMNMLKTMKIMITMKTMNKSDIKVISKKLLQLLTSNKF